MDKLQTLSAFAALSQSTRLDVFRLLVQAGSEGLLAGELAAKLDVRQNTMSANLSVLLQAGLVTNAREGRAIRYVADLQGLQGMLGYLLRECCGGKPELCEPFLQSVPHFHGAQTGSPRVTPKDVLK